MRGPDINIVSVPKRTFIAYKSTAEQNGTFYMQKIGKYFVTLVQSYQQGHKNSVIYFHFE